ncbi:hypothetical protein SAMD00019534_051780 [Acytostelium subglobosum LB1]|uniref:hypothetical protein n=1 Tax=Acytostelium subglobosum LB1 TaxID=1410327 RepID=UPI0006447D0C|nr:hypothetical protein SAMD00019534_051780 [Acytostelium subglobosum LB1]GAM22003.1 hypothetical protein SAMD00019534_051780 [Acytostelium subglobosum LB1]|eukprot:XP_012755103.1 hypothetical protein SAMD00019534_051780 [Acytostelium subglobosum LB1]
MFVHIFSFLFGVFAVIICAIYLFIRLLEILDDKTEKEYKQILADAIKKQSDRRTDTSRFNAEKKGRIFIKSPDASETQEWYQCVLKTNMLFLFKNSDESSAAGVICFDGCTISVIRNKTSKFHKKNGIIVTNNERLLMFHSKTLHFYFENGKELETWFWFLKEAAALTIKKTADEDAYMKLCQKFFVDLPIRAHVPKYHIQSTGNMGAPPITPATSTPTTGHRRYPSSGSSTASSPKLSLSPTDSLTPALEESIVKERKSHSSFVPSSSSSSSSSSSQPSVYSSTIITGNNNNNSSSSSSNGMAGGMLETPDLNSTVIKYDWFNVLLGRIFFNMYNSEMLLSLFASKITKKLDKIKKPSILKSITLKNIHLGPNLPILQNSNLLFVTPKGEVSVDFDLVYHGGFTLTIMIEVSFSIRGRSMTIPLVISVLIKSLQGRVNLQLLPPPSKRFWVGFYTEPQCELEVDTSIGPSRSSYFNLPKIAKIIINKLKAEVFEMMVLPSAEDFPLPGSKKKKVDAVDLATTTSATATTNNTTAVQANPQTATQFAVGSPIDRSSEANHTPQFI